VRARTLFSLGNLGFEGDWERCDARVNWWVQAQTRSVGAWSWVLWPEGAERWAVGSFIAPSSAASAAASRTYSDHTL
jgi:hypothetical protein